MTMIDEHLLSEALHNAAESFEVSPDARSRILAEVHATTPRSTVGGGFMHSRRSRSLVAVAAAISEARIPVALTCLKGGGGYLANVPPGNDGASASSLTVHRGSGNDEGPCTRNPAGQALPDKAFPAPPDGVDHTRRRAPCLPSVTCTVNRAGRCCRAVQLGFDEGCEFPNRVWTRRWVSPPTLS